MIGIYKWTNKINGKKYIGQSVNIENRKRQHIASAYYSKSNTYNTAFHKAIRKYGIDNFDFEIITLCELEELNVLEKFYIEKWNSFIPNGYNMTTGGENPRSCHNLFSKTDIKQIIEELKNTDDKSEIIAERWGCSASLIKKICTGDEYYIENENYPIRDDVQIKRVKNKYNNMFNGNNPSAKLTLENVEDIIYMLLNSDLTIKEIALKFNVCKDQISRINNGKVWLQIERPIPCRNTRKNNEAKAKMVADLLLNTNMSQKDILEKTGYKDRHTVQKINNHTVYKELLEKYPNPIRS